MTDKEFLLQLYLTIWGKVSGCPEYHARLREIIYTMPDNVSNEVICGGVSHEDMFPIIKEYGYEKF